MSALLLSGGFILFGMVLGFASAIATEPRRKEMGAMLDPEREEDRTA